MILMRNTIWLLLTALGLLLAADPQSPVFLGQKIDGPSPNWYGPFSEGSAVFDVNNDDVLDITAGEYWYEGPRYIKRPLRELDHHGEFVSNAGEFPYDVNGDGWTDLISAGWFGEQDISWYENNKGTGGPWKKHRIAESAFLEALIVEDIDGDGDPDILPCHYRPREVYWLEYNGGQFIQRKVGPYSGRHGVGLGDIDRDGRKDVITREGWYSAPEDRRNGEWAWHPEYNIEGAVGVPMLVFDVNGDGHNDIIFGMGHGYGLFWLQQTVTPAGRSWVRHTIDASWSQAHTMVLADVTGDGRPDLVTGKRLRGHQEKDPGSFEPLGLYWYDIDTSVGEFSRHVIAYNSMVGTGMQINVVDIDKDGDQDIVLSGKSGLFLLENMNNFQKRTPDIIQR